MVKMKKEAGREEMPAMRKIENIFLSQFLLCELV